MKEKEAEVLGPETPQETAMELVSSGAALVKLENTTQMQIAAQRPRNEDRVLSAALAELERYPSMADEAIYSKPVGKDPNTNAMKYVEGLSIRAAESLANRWANSAYACDVSSPSTSASFSFIAFSSLGRLLALSVLPICLYG